MCPLPEDLQERFIEVHELSRVQQVKDYCDANRIAYTAGPAAVEHFVQAVAKFMSRDGHET